jgi:hypothetical protein
MSNTQVPIARFKLDAMDCAFRGGGMVDIETGDTAADDQLFVLASDYERLEKLLMESYQENRELRSENTRLIMEHVL